MWTKRQIVVMAMEEAGLGDYVFNVTPDELVSACRRLDAMFALLSGRGIQVGYNMSSPDATDPDQDSGLPDSHVALAYSGLAMHLSPSYGKAANPETKQLYNESLAFALKAAAQPIPMQYPANSYPGAGYKNYDNRFTAAPVDPLTSNGSLLEFE